MNIFAKSLLVITVAAVVSGCVQHRYPTEVKNELDDAIASNPDKLPADVAAEMSVGQSVGTNSGIYAPTRRFRVQAENVDAKEFFASLLNETSYGIVVHPDVAGTISLDLQNVTIGEVLNAISSIYGYDIQQKGKIFYVYPAGVRTETFSVDYLLVKRSGLASLNITTGGVSSKDSSSDSNSDSNSNSNSSSSSDSSSDSSDSGSGDSFDGDSGTTVKTQTANDFWTSLEKAITNFIGKGNGKSVIVSPEAGLVVVSANPSELKAVKTFLDSAQQRLTKQILLEAKVLEVRLADEFQAGIDWSILGSSKHWRSDKEHNGDWSSYVGRTGVVDGITHIVFKDSNHFNLGVAVELLQTQGDVSILSSPRITASNNQKAVIKVGSDEYYVTSFEANSVTSSGTTSVTPSIEYTPFFSGVSLDVTPQIKDDGSVLMHIHPAVIKVEEQIKKVVYGDDQNVVLPMAKSTIRETDTVVQANSGDVIVIGGLIEERKVDETSKVPLLGDIPYIGNLFKSTDKVTEKVELVILIRPIVAGGETWKNELRRSNELLEKWYPSGLQKLD
ncbi:MAG: pilus (MSHA type) biogenesis protein MshL [Succinivibrionaceae bacterium]|nr:pilus (MSHA type) biogenesis protein MshL [Succinivibrionaceae bacterium]